MKTTAGGRTLESMSQAIWYNQWTLDKFSKFLHGDILEVGCGIGNFTRTLTKFGEVWGIDIDENFITQTKKEISKDAKIGFGDIEKGMYFFKNLTFDEVICLNVLEHIKDDEKALKNLNKLLRNRGILVLLVPAHRVLYGEIDRSIGHFRRYSKMEIVSKLENAGFEITNIRRINFLGAIGWFLAGKIFKQTLVDKNEIKLFNLIGPLILPIENLIDPPFGTSILVIASKKI